MKPISCLSMGFWIDCSKVVGARVKFQCRLFQKVSVMIYFQKETTT